MAEKRLFVAITGASGAIYAKRLLETLTGHYDRVYVTASEHSLSILKDELGIIELDDLLPNGNFTLLDPNEIGAPPASGSHSCDGMVIVPCSMGAVGRIAAGISNDLITRAADVCLKERRKLILVTRETPLSLIHLENMATLTRAGATIMPASPAFYHNPEKVDDLVDFVVDRILQHLELETRLVNGWQE
ncbi:MAG: UbiX family flavin prenyltransferase [Armatimonadota bacterium]